MAYIFCDSCGIGFHSNVRTCPECGRPASRAFHSNGHTQQHNHLWRTRTVQLREDVESEVREAIYGWHSGTVTRCETSAADPAEPASASMLA